MTKRAIIIAIAIAGACLLIAFLLPSDAAERPCFSAGNVQQVEALAHRLKQIERIVIIKGDRADLNENVRTLDEASIALRAQAQLLAASNAWGCRP
jgi:hypothetical protein